MAEIAEVQQVVNIVEPYTPKQLFGKLKTFEDLSDVVLYVPFVYNLIRDTQRTCYATDIFSHSLTQVLGNHPLVITELARKVFETMPPIILPSDQKGFERIIYVTPKAAWKTLEEHLQTVTAVDKVTHRFCVFRMYEEEIPCPLGSYSDKKVKVWYCNLYGNRETYYFAKATDDLGGEMMRLYYSPPIKEVVDLGNYLLGLLQDTTDETAYSKFTEKTQGTDMQAKLLAIQKNDKLQKALAAKPLEESQLTVKQRADVYEMIKTYYRIYGENNEQQNTN